MNKKVLVAAAIALTSATSFATTARLTALGNAVQFIDIQNVFERPTDMHLLGDAMVFEFGAASTVASSAQGGFVKTIGEGKLGFFLGYGDATRVAGGTETFLGSENPFTVSYGMKTADMPWAVSVTNSSSDVKTDEQKQSKMALSGAVVIGDTTVNATLGLGDTATGTLDGAAKDTDAKYTGTNMKVGAWHAMGDWNFYGQFASTGTKIENTAAHNSEIANTDMKVGFVNSMKKEGTEFFYGAAYQALNENNKTTSTKTDTTQMPVIIGLESDAASWLTLRGSITQNVLLGGTKTTQTNTIAHDTTVAAGAGVKFNKASIDMTLSAATSGNVGTNNIGGKAALNYMF